MFGGCQESDPNRFVRFVKGIWGVTTLYSGPRVLPGYWLPSQKGSSLNQPYTTPQNHHTPNRSLLLTRPTATNPNGNTHT